MAEMGAYLAFDVDHISMNPTGGELVACERSVKVDDEDLAGTYRDFTFYDGMTTIKKDGKMDDVWDNPAFRLRDRSEWYWQE